MVPGCAWWFWDVYIGSLQLRANPSCLLCAAGAPPLVYLYLVVYSVLQSAPGQCLARSRPANNTMFNPGVTVLIFRDVRSDTETGLRFIPDLV